MNPGNRSRAIEYGLILTLTGILVYANHLNNPFQFDTVQFIPENAKFVDPGQMLTWDHLVSNFFSRGTLFATFALNAKMGAMDPFGYHLTNLLLHIFNTFLLFFVTVKLLRHFKLDQYEVPAQTLSVLTAFIFLVHPIQTESVVYVISRSEVLAGTFYLLAFGMFQMVLEAGSGRSSRVKRVTLGGLIALAFVIGFSVKQTMATLPMILFLYYLFAAPAESPLRQFLSRWKWVLSAVLVMALGALFYKLFTDESFLIGPSAAGEAIGRKNYFLTQAWVVAFYYVKLLLFPLNLTIDPDIPAISSWASPRFWSCLMALAGGLVLAARVPRSRGYLFLLCWYLIILSPSSSIVTLMDYAAEHRVYLASYGIILIGVLLAFECANRLRVASPQKVSILTTVALVLVIALLSAMTVKRNTVWASELSLWHDAEKKSPKLVRPLINLGRAYSITGDNAKAIEYYERSLALQPNYFEPNYNVAVLYGKAGRQEDALRHFQHAAVLSPHIPDVFGQLGKIYLNQKEFEKANAVLRRAVELNPRYAEAFSLLGVLHYFFLDQKPVGLNFIRRSLFLNPNQPNAEKYRALLAQGAGAS